ncbi:MAG: hypothetical protein K2L17_10885 [Muribaculaceae bacterium]|nr:hypothetical protein [Muribaculaceae bacterium]
MERRFFYNIMIAVVGLIGSLYVIGCNGPSDIDDRLNIAEELMEDMPDSALYILNCIDGSDLRGNRIKARYALLKSMALDKNYINTTTFDVLQPAIDYYLRKGNPDEKIRTYYYKGRIHRNAGDDDIAMQSYLMGLDNLDQISDSLTLARILVAQATLYYRQYQINDFVDNNLRAAEIYGRLDKHPLQLKSNLRALTGEIILNNKHKADSILMECNAIVKDSPSLKRATMLPFLKCAVNFGTEEEILKIIEDVQNTGVTDDMNMTLSMAYSKVGEPNSGLKYLNEAKIAPENILDSLTYWSVKAEILESLGEDRASLDAFKNYSSLLDGYHAQLFSNELLFSEKKHAMEIESMGKIHKRDNAIKWILAGVAVLICIIGFIYYRYRLNKAGRIIAEQNAERLQLEADKLHLETEKLQLQTKNMYLEISQLENEQERLSALLEQRDELSSEMKNIVRERLDLLNGLLAKEISNDDTYAKPFRKYVEIIHKDRKKFQNSTRKAFQAMYPKFIDDLIKHGLTEREINYVCLYSLGLRGKEIGSYLDLARHYNISSDIRRKLGLDPNESNLGPYIRKMMKQEK